MLRDNIDPVVHLGDYIFEYEGRDGKVRKHHGDEIHIKWVQTQIPWGNSRRREPFCRR